MRRPSLSALSTTSLTALAPVTAIAQTGDSGPDYLIIFGGMGLAVLIVALICWTVARAQQTRYETIRSLIEKGQEIPPQLLPGTPAPKPVQKSRAEAAEDSAWGVLLWGILFSFLGVGIGLAAYLSSGDIRKAAWGLILLFVGLGLLTFLALAVYVNLQAAKDGDAAKASDR